MGRTYATADSEDGEASSYFVIIPDILVRVESRFVLFHRRLLVKPGNLVSDSKSKGETQMSVIYTEAERIETYSLIPIAKSFLIALLE